MIAGSQWSESSLLETADTRTGEIQSMAQAVERGGVFRIIATFVDEIHFRCRWATKMPAAFILGSSRFRVAPMEY